MSITTFLHSLGELFKLCKSNAKFQFEKCSECNLTWIGKMFCFECFGRKQRVQRDHDMLPRKKKNEEKPFGKLRIHLMIFLARRKKKPCKLKNDFFL